MTRRAARARRHPGPDRCAATATCRRPASCCWRSKDAAAARAWLARAGAAADLGGGAPGAGRRSTWRSRARPAGARACPARSRQHVPAGASRGHGHRAPRPRRSATSARARRSTGCSAARPRPSRTLLLLLYAKDAAGLARLLRRARGRRAGLTELHRLPTTDLGERRALRLPRRHLAAAVWRASAAPAPATTRPSAPASSCSAIATSTACYTARPLLPARPTRRVLPRDAEGTGDARPRPQRQLPGAAPAGAGRARLLAASSTARRRAASDPNGARPRKMVGRWPSGAPLVLSPDADDPAASRAANDFALPRRRIRSGCAARWPRTSAAPTRATRSTRPRDRDASLAVNRRHRLLRRGRYYGPALTIEQALARRPRRRTRGLYFVVPQREPRPPVRVRPADLGQQPQVRRPLRRRRTRIGLGPAAATFTMPAAGVPPRHRRAALRDRARRRATSSCRASGRCATWPRIGGRAGTPRRRSARSADAVHLLAQPRQLPVHAQPRAALVAQRPVLGDAVPGVVGEHAARTPAARASRISAAGSAARPPAPAATAASATAPPRSRSASGTGRSAPAGRCRTRPCSRQRRHHRVAQVVVGRPAAAAAAPACAPSPRWNEYFIAWPSPSR